MGHPASMPGAAKKSPPERAYNFGLSAVLLPGSTNLEAVAPGPVLGSARSRFARPETRRFWQIFMARSGSRLSKLRQGRNFG